MNKLKLITNKYLPLWRGRIEGMAFGGTIVTVLIHFLLCGIPLMLILAGSWFGIYSSVNMHFISEGQRTGLIVISGFLLLTSFLIYRKERKCCHNMRSVFWKKTILLSSFALYVAGILFHIISTSSSALAGCH